MISQIYLNNRYYQFRLLFECYIVCYSEYSGPELFSDSDVIKPKLKVKCSLAAVVTEYRQQNIFNIILFGLF